MTDSTWQGYPLFNEVEDPNLRSWNRVAVMHNMASDGAGGLVKPYIEQLDKAGKLGCFLVLKVIKEQGPEAARSALLNNNTEH